MDNSFPEKNSIAGRAEAQIPRQIKTYKAENLWFSIKKLILDDSVSYIAILHPNFALESDLYLQGLCVTIVYQLRDQYLQLVQLLQGIATNDELEFFEKLWTEDFSQLPDLITEKFEELEEFISAEFKYAFYNACETGNIQLLKCYAQNPKCLPPKAVFIGISKAIYKRKDEALNVLKDMLNTIHDEGRVYQFFLDLYTGRSQDIATAIIDDAVEEEISTNKTPSLFIENLPYIITQGNFLIGIPDLQNKILGEALIYFTQLNNIDGCKVLLHFGASADYKNYIAVSITSLQGNLELFNLLLENLPYHISHSEREKLKVEALRRNIEVGENENFKKFFTAFQPTTSIEKIASELLTLAGTKWKFVLGIDSRLSVSLCHICEFLKPPDSVKDYEGETVATLVELRKYKLLESFMKRGLSATEGNLQALKKGIERRDFQIIRLFARKAGTAFLYTFKDDILKFAFDLWVQALKKGKGIIEARKVCDFIWGGFYLQRQDWLNEALNTALKNEDIILANTLIREYGAIPTDPASFTLYEQIRPAKLPNPNLQALYSQTKLKIIAAIAKEDFRIIIPYLEYIFKDLSLLKLCLKFAIQIDQKNIVEFLLSYAFSILQLNRVSLTEIGFLALLIHNKKYYIMFANTYPYLFHLNPHLPYEDLLKEIQEKYTDEAITALESALYCAIRVAPNKTQTFINQLLKINPKAQMEAIIYNLMLSGNIEILNRGCTR